MTKKTSLKKYHTIIVELGNPKENNNGNSELQYRLKVQLSNEDKEKDFDDIKVFESEDLHWEYEEDGFWDLLFNQVNDDIFYANKRARDAGSELEYVRIYFNGFEIRSFVVWEMVHGYWNYAQYVAEVREGLEKFNSFIHISDTHPLIIDKVKKTYRLADINYQPMDKIS